MRVRSLHHAFFEITDLERTEAFARDFGLLSAERTEQRLVMRTSGGDAYAYVADKSDTPRFGGIAFEVEQAEDLEQAVAVHGATAVEPLPLPGGGSFVALTDPDGFEIRLVHGIARRKADASQPDLTLNAPGTYARAGRFEPKRKLGPACLFRLGHVGLFVKSFAQSRRWYEQVLGLIPSEIYHVPGQPEAQIIGFMRLNRGGERVDHHCVALMQSMTGESACHHISFEAQDFDAQFVAHRYLQDRGHEAVWGVGRHPHGSHVFDVWRDPDRNRFETFSDTDLLTERDGTRIHDLHDVEMDVWSSDPPDRYFA